MSYLISGIQQVGIGVPAVHRGWEWYRNIIGMDLPVFEEAAEASLMLPYTGGKPRSRHAILALNYGGGGGLEIWQYTSRQPVAATFDIQYGDIGIQVCMFKCHDVDQAYRYFQQQEVHILSEPVIDAHGRFSFYAKDLFGNWIQIVESHTWYRKCVYNTGGVYGVAIGVSDMEAALPFYKNILHYDEIVSDVTGQFEDVEKLYGGSETCRRVLLTHSIDRQGPFSNLLGKSYVELIEVKDRPPKTIFQDRFWGDLGYIHLCFDVRNMDQLKAYAAEKGHSFTVDSADSFDMGEAAGRFAYCEDPDGTLIEFVETHKIPIIKKLNWYLNLSKQPDEKALPNYFLKAMALGRKKVKENLLQSTI